MLHLRRLSLALAMTFLASAAGCGHLMHNGSDEPPAQVIFVNQSLDQADVYVVGSAGDSQRIGTVFAGRTETLTIPNNVLARGGTVTIAARLLARTVVPRTGPISFSRGEQLQITLPSDERTLTVLPAP
jgi:hypothetical protein